jgi:hypothetical protein
VSVRTVKLTAIRYDDVIVDYFVNFTVASEDLFDPTPPTTRLRIAAETAVLDLQGNTFPTASNLFHSGSITIINDSDQWSHRGYVEIEKLQYGHEVGTGYGYGAGCPDRFGGRNSPKIYFDPIEPRSAIIVYCGGVCVQTEDQALVAAVYENSSEKLGDIYGNWDIQDSLLLGAFEDYHTQPPSGGVTLTRGDLTLTKLKPPQLSGASIEPNHISEVNEGGSLKLNWKAVWSDSKYATGGNNITIVSPSAGCSITTDGLLVTSGVTEDTYVTVMVELVWDKKSKVGTKIIKIKNLAAPAVAPAVTTAAVSGAGHDTATAGGNVTGNGGVIVSERGVVYGRAVTPTTASATKVTSGGGAGVFTANLTELSAGTTYYLRAYAINSVGTGYGAQVSFTTQPLPAALHPFEITALSIPDSGPVSVGFRARAGLAYALERSTDLKSWNVVATLIAVASGVSTLGDTSARPLESYFYRISERR